MRAKITRIDIMKSSRNKNQAFTRIHFKVKTAPGEYCWAKTDIVPSFRNYKNWRPYLDVGTILDGLILRGTDTIDADSIPILVARPTKEDKVGFPQLEVLQNKLF